MTTFNSSRLPFILAIALHVVIFLALFLHFSGANPPQPPLQPDVNIIKAIAVSPNQVPTLKPNVKPLQQAPPPAPVPTPPQPVTPPAPPSPPKQEDVVAQQNAAIAQQAKAAQDTAAAKLAQQQADAAKQAQQKAADQAALLQKQQADQAAAAQKAKQEQAKQDQARQEQEKQTLLKKQQAEKKRQAAAAKLKAAQQQELAQQLAAEQKDLEIARTKQQQSEIDKYKAMIVQALHDNWLVPDGVNHDLSCELFIRLNASGQVLSVEVSRSSGDIGLDNSARTAVFKASPLPIPNDPDLARQFRELRLTVTP